METVRPPRPAESPGGVRIERAPADRRRSPRERDEPSEAPAAGAQEEQEEPRPGHGPGRLDVVV